MANSDATNMLLVDALLGSDSECDGAANVLNSRWTAWQRNYGTGAMTASQSSGHGPPPQPPDSRLANAPGRAEPPPQPIDRVLQMHVGVPSQHHNNVELVAHVYLLLPPLELQMSRTVLWPTEKNQTPPNVRQTNGGTCKPDRKIHRWINVALAEMGGRHLRHSQTELVG